MNNPFDIEENKDTDAKSQENEITKLILNVIITHFMGHGGHGGITLIQL